MAGKVKLTIRAQLYLRCIDDWKAPYEVVALLGDTPPTPERIVRRMLTGFLLRGFAEHHYGNDTFRITPAGRAHLASSGKTGE